MLRETWLGLKMIDVMHPLIMVGIGYALARVWHMSSVQREMSVNKGIAGYGVAMCKRRNLKGAQHRTAHEDGKETLQLTDSLIRG